MLILGLTGGIATGKSTVGAMFQELGAVRIDADLLAREVVEPGKPAWQAVINHFGHGVLQEDGRLDRKALAHIVFGDKAQLSVLNSITHPFIIALAGERIALAHKQGASIVLLEAPLLFETGLDRLVDQVIVVATTEETQIRRLMARDGLSVGEARQRMAAQMPLAEKIRRADHCIDNNGSLEETRAQVERLWRKLTKECSNAKTL